MAVRIRALSLVTAVGLIAFAATTVNTPSTRTPGTTLIGWNNLGMHCMDSTFDVFAILPPYNTIHAHLIRDGALVRSGAGITVTYEAVPDESGSVNTTSIGKTDFWKRSDELFGASPAYDMGLAGKGMPGSANVPQVMTWDPANDWWIAEGIPITPKDDAMQRNPYPMMRLAARDASGTVLATTDIVLPVSDEMDCSACHASGGSPTARPLAGWVNDADPVRDYRLNILRRHDDFQKYDPDYAAALAAAGYNASGLYAEVTAENRSVLCANCHASNALGTTGRPGVTPLTTAMHARHANVVDPLTQTTLDATENRTACYRCHPGSATKCLRGTMGNAVAADGTMAIQCVNCHGTMSAVGDPARRGWLDEPNCQNCHTGTAVDNNGQIRYETALEPSGALRQAVNPRFATEAGLPMPGTSLYRFSHGHGGLACQACHGSTHAEYVSSHASDNVQSTFVQGHAGTLVECSACHGRTPVTSWNGPHGMHPVAQSWIEDHGDALEGEGEVTAATLASCKDCHGSDLRGTVLSVAKADRTFSAFGTHRFYRGSEIGCWACHAGPTKEGNNPNQAPVASNASAETTAGAPVGISLHATDTAGTVLVYRIISQPVNGTVGLAGSTATYFPAAGFTGTDTFTFAARDGQTDSNLATVQVSVGGAAGTPDLGATWKSLRTRRQSGRVRVTGTIAVKNVGAAAAGASTLKIGLSTDGTMHPTDRLLRTVKVPALAIGHQRLVQVSVLLPRGVKAKGSFAIAHANASGAVADVNAANDLAVFGPIP